MQQLVRGVLVTFLAALLASGLVAPGTAGAAYAPRQSNLVPSINWIPGSNLGTITVHQGQTITRTVWFMSNMHLTNVQVASSLNLHNVQVTPQPSFLPRVARNTPVRLRLTISAQQNAGVAVQQTELRLFANFRGRQAVRLYHTLYFGVDVVQAQSPLVNWMPGNNLGTITVPQGQEVTRTIWFRSNMPLTNVQAVSFLNLHFVHVTAQPASLQSVAPYTSVQVRLTISADLSAGVAVHQTGLYLSASFNGGSAVRLYHTLYFSINVVQPPRPSINWMSGNNLGTITVHKGQAVTRTIWFRSNMPLTNIQVVSSLSLHFVHVTAQPSSLQSVAANTPVQVTLTVSADLSAGVDVHQTSLYLTGSFNGGSAVRLYHTLYFSLNVVQSQRPSVNWAPGLDLGTITLNQGQTVTRTVSFTSNMALTNVQVISSPSLSYLHVTAQPAFLQSVAANSPVSLTITISADPSAVVAAHEITLHLVGSFNGGPAVRLYHSLYFAVSVQKSM